MINYECCMNFEEKESHEMKSTGIVRKVDELGRIVIPVGLRKKFNIQDNVDLVEIFNDGDMIIIKKYEPSCMFCHEENDLISYKEHKICKSCLEEINKAL